MAKPGRKPYKPTDDMRKMVRNMAMAGFQQAQMAKAIGVSVSTLAKHYQEELEHGATTCTANVCAKLYDKAMDGDTTAAIFWMKTRGGWREGMDVNHQSQDGSMTPRVVTVIGQDASQ